MYPMVDRRLSAIKEAASPTEGKPARAPWGVGRIAFFARLDAITADLAGGWPMTTIYQRHKAALGISYSGFCKLVRRHANDARPGRRIPGVPSSDARPTPPNRWDAVAPPATPLTTTLQDGPPSHAEHEQPRGSFRYSPHPKEGEIDRLFGSGFFAGKK
jgi:hypothetical protein